MSDKRKARTDKGRVYITARVENVVKWVIEMDEVSVPQLQILLARYADKPTVPNPHYNPQQPTVSLTRALNIIRRWKDAGWIEYRNPYRDPAKPGSVYATRKGLKDFGYEYLTYRVRELESLDHIFRVNWVRLWLGLWMRDNGYKGNWKWKSERVLRVENPNEKYIPDAKVEYGNSIANVEVEISRKSLDAYKKLRQSYEESVGSSGKLWYFHDVSLTSVLTSVFGDIARLQSFDKLYLEDGQSIDR